jgi:hypothetical protein
MHSKNKTISKEHTLLTFCSGRLLHYRNGTNTKYCNPKLTLSKTVDTTHTIRFNVQQHCILPTQCIYVFCKILKTKQ